MRRSLAALAVWGIVVALVAGCSSSSRPSSPPSSPTVASETPSSSKQAGDPLPAPSALLKQSRATTKDLTSVHLVLSVTGKVAQMPVKALEGVLTDESDTANKDESTTTTKSEPGTPATPGTGARTEPGGAANSEPDTVEDSEPTTAAKGTATIAIMGSDVDIKFVVVGGHLYVELPGEAWKDYGPASKAYNVAAILDPDSGLANMLADFIDPKAEGRETVGEEQTIRVTGKVTADAVNKLVPQLEATKRMSCTVWIQESGDHQLVRATLEPGKDDEIQMTFSNWNAPVTIDRPAGA